MPAEGTCAIDVDVEIPADHRLTALPEPVHVQDRREVVELVVRAVLEGLPDRALRRLAVAAEDPDAVRKPVEVLPRERHPDADRQTLAQRAGRDVHPRDEWCGMPLQPAPELPVGHELLVRDRPGGLVDRVEERRGVSLGEDKAVVLGALRCVEVVAEVLRDEDRHQVRGRHRGRRVTGPGRRAAADGVDAQLLSELLPALDVVHVPSSVVRHGVSILGSTRSSPER